MTFRLGSREVKATVIEDRGAIGINGRHLVRVRVEPADAEPQEFELPAEELAVSR